MKWLRFLFVLVALTFVGCSAGGSAAPEKMEQDAGEATVDASAEPGAPGGAAPAE